jgi:hypothetical protein
MLFGKKEKTIIRPDFINISTDSTNKIYLNIEWTEGNQQQVLTLMRALLDGSLRPTLLNCMATIDNEDVQNLVRMSAPTQDPLNPLNVR